jgi:hypothetical protein
MYTTRVNTVGNINPFEKKRKKKHTHTHTVAVYTYLDIST